MTEREEYESWANTHKPMVALTLKSNLSYFETWQAGRNTPHPRPCPYKTDKYKGLPIEYDYFADDISVTWESPTTAICRFHLPATTASECSYYSVVFLKVVDGTCELKGLVMDPGVKIHRAMRKYLKSVGLKGFYRRLKDGKVITVWYK